MNWMEWLTLILLVGSFATGIYYSDKMPEYMATHWNFDGEVDGYMGKDMGLFLIPGMLLFMVLLFYLVPKIDPLKENIKQFEKYYQGMIFLVVLFISYVYFLSIAWNLGYEFDMGKMVMPGVGVLFIYMGIMCGETKQNWFIGVKTPWTLSSDRVWEKTHGKAKNVFVGLGALWIVAGLFFPSLLLYIIVLLVLASIWLFVDSYLEYGKEMRERKSASVEVKDATSWAAPAAPVKKAAVKKEKPVARKRLPVKKKAPSKRKKKK